MLSNRIAPTLGPGAPSRATSNTAAKIRGASRAAHRVRQAAGDPADHEHDVLGDQGRTGRHRTARHDLPRARPDAITARPAAIGGSIRRTRGLLTTFKRRTSCCDVQESLTNVVKHACPARAQVTARLPYTADQR